LLGGGVGARNDRTDLAVVHDGDAVGTCYRATRQSSNSNDMGSFSTEEHTKSA
jgi:hypothetical protein